MPAREIPTRSRKNETFVKPIRRFTNPGDIKRSLAVQDETSLVEALTTLRNQFTVKYDESPISASDERLLLVKAWLETSPGAQDVFTIWEAATMRQMSLLSMVVSVLSSILSLLSSHFMYQSFAQPIIKTLLSPQWLHLLSSYLGGSHTELVLVTLKLFNSLSTFASGRERKAVFEVFPWETKSLPKLLHMRRKNKSDADVDILARPDIRTLFVTFLLSFVDGTTPSAIKTAFLEQRRDLFSSFFRGLWQDHYSLIRRVLEICWTGIWSDQKIRRTLKIGLFNESILSQLVRLYERSSTEDGELEHIPADVVHHFLLAICTRPGVGVCFKDKGWYPRDLDAEGGMVDDHADVPNESADRRSGRIYNKILANVLKTLKVNEDPRQQELALKILGACPELTAGYWSSAGLALEPRNSSKWIANIAFFGSVVSMPVPHSTFILPNSHDQHLYQPVPPPLNTVLDNIMPSANIKTHLSRGLQSPSALVQHCSALALVKCLMKYGAVQDAFEIVEKALEEDEEGQWHKRRNEVEKEIRRRVPDFQVIVGFSQKLMDTGNAKQRVDADVIMSDAGALNVKEPSPNPAKYALLAECAQRLLWLYQRWLPFLVAEARFDVGKLLSGVQDAAVGTESELTPPTVLTGIHILRQLHVLRLLGESEQFTWYGKTGGSHSNLYTLMKAYARSGSQPIRSSITHLLRSALTKGLLFQHDPDEVSLWLESLPTSVRSANTKAPDGALLTDEGESVILFLDDCAQRCVKAPYRYLEDLHSLVLEGCASDHHSTAEVPVAMGQSDVLPSPLLMTILEQFGAKLKGQLLSPSAALAVLTYMRKLISRLSGKMRNPSILKTIAERARSLVQPSQLYPQYPSMTSAILRESDYLKENIEYILRPRPVSIGERSSAVEEFLAEVEGMSIPSAAADRRKCASELVDWYRLIDYPLTAPQVRQLASLIERFDPSVLGDFYDYLRPDQHSLWSCVDITHYCDLRFGFERLFIHCGFDRLEDTDCRRILVQSITSKTTDLVEIKRAFILIHHRLALCPDDASLGALLLLLADIISEGQKNMHCPQFSDLVDTNFQSDVMKELCNKSLSPAVRQGLQHLLRAFLCSCGDEGKEIIRQFSSRWSYMISETLLDMADDQRATASLWIESMPFADLLVPLDTILTGTIHTGAQSNDDITEGLLRAVDPFVFQNQQVMKSRVPGLLKLSSSLAHQQLLDSILAKIMHGNLPLCHDGFLISQAGDAGLPGLVAQAQRQWAQQFHGREDFDITVFLTMHDWSEYIVDVVVALLYTKSSARSLVSSWLKTNSPAPCATEQLARIISSLLDSGRMEDAPEEQGNEYLVPHFSRLVRFILAGKNSGKSTPVLCADCVCLMIQQLESIRPHFLSLLQEQSKMLAPDQITPQLLAIIRRLASVMPVESAILVNSIVDQGLRWAVQQFSGPDEETEGRTEILKELAVILRLASPVKSHVAEPILTVLIQNWLSDMSALQFMRILIEVTPMKPATVNKYLQSIIQHPQLSAVDTSALQDPLCRDGIVHMLHTLFHLQPTNTCQPTHIEPLLRLYKGTLSLSDRRLLSIFQLFEATRKTSVARLLAQWSSSPDTLSSSALEAVQSLDPSLLFKTCLSFPDWRTLMANVSDEHHHLKDDSLYDPIFVIPLFAQMLHEGPPTSGPGWVQLFRTNIVSLLVRACSAKHDQIREIGLAQIAALYKCLQDADMQEQPEVIRLLSLLKDALPEVIKKNPPRLPAYISLLLAHALRGIFYPANFIYPITARFLLQRPELDVRDVPMLLGMLYNSSEQWKKERGWIIRFLADGMASSDEWRILKRRHTWDLLASLLQSETKDRSLRRGILEVLANVTCNAHATSSLVLKSSLLSWIELQLRSVQEDDGIAWTNILANIIAVADFARWERATSGEWRFILSRCILRILNSSACNGNMFCNIVPVVLQLCTPPGAPARNTSSLVARCFIWLKSLEARVTFPTSIEFPRALKPSSNIRRRSPPYSARVLFEPPPLADSLEQWGACVEGLWRVTMAQPEKCLEWDELTARLLIWRAIVGEEGSEIGEWARKEVVANLRTTK